MSSAAWPLQEAVAAVISSAVAPVTVVDVLPASPSYPLVVIGDDVSKDWSTSESFGEDVTITIHVWSNDADREEIKTIQQQIYTALHDQDLIVAGYNVTAVLFVSSETQFDQDKVAFHGTSKFRCLVSA